MPSASSNSPHVLILGAGLGGLTLAQALRKQGITFEVFERDKSLHSRSQGWAIALHSVRNDLASSVPDDLPPLSVVNHLLPLSHLQPELGIYATGFKDLKVGSNGELKMLRANRSRLRDWLSTNLDIRWDKHATSIEENHDSVTIHFSDGSSATGDVLVGADGVHSFIRRHLLDGADPLQTIPQGFVVGETTLDKAEYERQFELAKSAYIVNDSERFIRMFVGLNSVSGDAMSARYYWMMSWKDDEATHKDYWTQNASKEQLYDHALELSKQIDLDPELTEIVRLTKPEGIMTPSLVIRDMVLTDLPNRRVTLLGDAAHPMTPFRGEGGNNALQDSLNLARAIAGSQPSTLLASLKKYQDEMLVRGGKAVMGSRAAGADPNMKLAREAWKSWAANRQRG